MFIVVCFASVVQALFGMGYGLTAAPLLALIDPVYVPVPTIVIGMISSTIGAANEIHQVEWNDVRFAYRSAAR